MSIGSKPKIGTMESLREMFAKIDDQKKSKFDEISTAIKNSNLPLTEELIEQVCYLGGDGLKALRNHPGYRISQKLLSYRTSFDIFDLSFQDLFKSVFEFKHSVFSGSDQGPEGKAHTKRIERQVQKELFAAVNSVHSLVEHSRRLQKILPVEHYDDKRREIFGQDGLHEFIVATRTLIHHVQMIRPGWRITQRRDVEDDEATFVISKNLISEAVRINPQSITDKNKVNDYLNKSPDQIDLTKIFVEYIKRAKTFRDWWGAEIQNQMPISLSDYNKCVRRLKLFGNQTSWNALIGNWINWRSPPNPYEHLSKFLTQEQIDIVNLLPHGSQEQIDQIISFGDTGGICYGNFRKTVYKIFYDSIEKSSTKG